MRAPLANALALGMGSLVALGLGEVGARLFAPQPTGPVWFAHDADLGALPVPGEHGERTWPGAYRFSFTHDARGLRVVPAAAGVAAKQTVLVLGDSYTYGLGVDDDQTYCNILQEALRSDPPARVVNAGNPAKGTDYALRFFLARQAAIRPDVVLLAFFKNDFGDNAREAYFSRTPTGALVPKPPKDARSARRLLRGAPPRFRVAARRRTSSISSGRPPWSSPSTGPDPATRSWSRGRPTDRGPSCGSILTGGR